MKTRVFRLRRIWRSLIVCVLTVPLTACITAAIPLTMAASAAFVGFSGYKLYQTTSGSKVGTEFKNEQISPEAREVLGTTMQLAFWASPDRTLVEAAEQVEQSMSFKKIVSPAQSAQVIEELGLPSNVKAVMTSERRAAFKTFADATGSDAVVAIVEHGMRSKMSVMSLSRSKLTYQSQVFLYSKEFDKEVWVTSLDLVVGMGSSTPSPTELEGVMGKAIAERLNDISNGSAYAPN